MDTGSVVRESPSLPPSSPPSLSLSFPYNDPLVYPVSSFTSSPGSHSCSVHTSSRIEVFISLPHHMLHPAFSKQSAMIMIIVLLLDSLQLYSMCTLSWGCIIGQTPHKQISMVAVNMTDLILWYVGHQTEYRVSSGNSASLFGTTLHNFKPMLSNSRQVQYFASLNLQV